MDPDNPVLLPARVVRWCAVCLAISFAQEAVCQRIIIVDKYNPIGAHYSDIHPAIQAAVVGDVVLVRGGDFSGPVIIDKGISLIAQLPAYVAVNGPIVVQNIPEGQTVVGRAWGGVGPALGSAATSAS